VGQGRWKYEGHITLGESCVEFMVAKLVSQNVGAHRSKVLLLEDNMACSGAFNTCRSPAPALNYLLRERAIHTVAARIQLLLPWVDTSLQPADEASRLQKPAGPDAYGSSPRF
jgi:hypothetical protein